MITMVFIRIDKRGNREYAYEVTSYWDKKLKAPRQKRRYMGIVLDKEKKIFEKKSKKKPEKLILDFGDTYLLNKFFEKVGLASIIKEVFENKSHFVLAMICYRLCYPSAMRYAKAWSEGNYARILYGVDLSSQRISDFFKIIGEESLQRDFFMKYLSEFSKAEKGIIIDATSLPNQIHIPLTAWGRNQEDIDKQIRFLLVVDKEENPLFFRHYSGNIVDVSTLQNTILELEKLGIEYSYAYLDAGYFSEENILDLYNHNIHFLTRLPSARTLYKELIKNEAKNLELISNGIRYGKRGLFVKQQEIKLFGKKAYAHIVLDPQRKGREISNFLMNVIDEKDAQKKDLEYTFLTRGIMILVSSFKINKENVVPAHYIRQTAEKMFGFSKDDLEILPLRVHTEETLSGFLFMQFLSLIAFVQLKKQLGDKHTVEEFMLAMRNIKCKVYDDELIISELTKQQKSMAKKIEILVPKNLGV